MKKLTIKSVQSFCELSQSLQGQITLGPEEWSYCGNTVDVRFRPHNLDLTFSFEGSQDSDGYYITGHWSACVPAVCSRCTDQLDMKLNVEYQKVYLKDGEVNTLECDYDIIECWLTNFDLLPWLLSEVIIQVPISPKHDDCQLNPIPSSREAANKIVLDKDKFFQKIK